MFVGDPAGNYDRILDFSTAKTGSLFLYQQWICLVIFGIKFCTFDSIIKGDEYP